MAVPVGTDDVVAGAAKYLASLAAVRAVVGTYPNSSVPLIVPDDAPARADMPQSTAVALVHAGPVATPGEHSDSAVQLQVELWADGLRDAGGNIVEPSETRRRMVAAWQVIDAALHRPEGGEQWWGDVLTQYCERSAGLTPYPVPNSDGLWRGTAFYTVGLL